MLKLNPICWQILIKQFYLNLFPKITLFILIIISLTQLHPLPIVFNPKNLLQTQEHQYFHKNYSNILLMPYNIFFTFYPPTSQTFNL